MLIIKKTALLVWYLTTIVSFITVLPRAMKGMWWMLADAMGFRKMRVKFNHR